MTANDGVTMTTEELRAAIEAALRRRYGENTSAKVSHLAHDSGWHSVRAWAETGEWPTLVHATTRALPTEIDAMHALAALVGLREDGSDPAEECERLREELARAQYALREWGPGCEYPGCGKLAPQRCEDCGARFCDAHDDGRTGHDTDVAAPMPHAVGPDDLMAGAAMRSAEVAR